MDKLKPLVFGYKVINHTTDEIYTIPSAELIGVYGSDNLICNAARVSHGTKRKFKRTDEELIEHLLRNEHWSPFEFGDVHFLLTVPKYVAIQMMRHRTAKVSEKSLRYSTTYEVEFIDTDLSYGNMMNLIIADAVVTYYDSVQSANRETNRIPREVARKVLPMCFMTEVQYKIDIRNFFNMYKQRRAGGHAQPETQIVAESMWNLAEPHFPITFKKYTEIYGINK